jgi:hypothetical protein
MITPLAGAVTKIKVAVPKDQTSGLSWITPLKVTTIGKSVEGVKVKL